MDEITYPKFLSLEFHTRFFPALLSGRLRPKEREGTRFVSSHALVIALVLCLILVVIGVPYAVSHRSLIGWLIGGIGLAGILALIVNSVLSRRGEPPSYDRFLFGIFFFFVALGLTSGVFIGTLEHSIMRGLLISAAGFIAGYVAGIFAGLWLQRLGWMANVLNALAGLAIFGMLFVDLVLLAGSLF
jgi:hypothetical protein